jgi:hypothetical protein
MCGPQVCLNVNVENVGLDVHLTADQARLLAESLIAVASVIEGNG